MYDNDKLNKDGLVTLCCHTTHCIRLKHVDYDENDGLYTIYGNREDQDTEFLRRWLHYFVTEVYKSHFRCVGFNYLAKKG